ncbi:aldo/keto reductase [Alisedimentitalea sp. MJ-SS2]|uniref:aldo/keto reductase n=1 Tax=Aliisedimentitalea sp. MJ-SS2 TaxID=3049795 RepID=UPI002911AA00|nr:aldo/keto reductase [Alisedimentitalea sp. MJ-SS2]MDU8927112.1 aldo/keto reductase [Alisedimentitalea sp. MJ-SS2]
MRRVKLAGGLIDVSELCLGSMTWGTQTPEDGAFRQIDMALEHGVDFIDTAHMYPVNPVKFETLGRTEEIIGNWCASSGRRNEVVIATKHLGEGSAAIPGGTPRITPETVPEAVEGSLKRLQTDVIDLYQLHWPNRGSYMFRKNWTYDPRSESREAVNGEIDDILGALAREVEKGRIRAFGLSNESAWGTAQWLAGAERTGGPRVATIQNEYSLLCRLFDTDWAELSVMEDVPLLAFSPLATGLLTGKYQDEAMPDDSRMAVAREKTGSTDLGGRVTPRVFDAVAAYLDIAMRHGLDPAQMALAWQLTRPFTCIPIFGATTMDQLEVALGAADVTLTDEVLDEIDTAHRAHPMPY